jgi:hypothetical protein
MMLSDSRVFMSRNAVVLRKPDSLPRSEGVHSGCRESKRQTIRRALWTALTSEPPSDSLGPSSSERAESAYSGSPFIGRECSSDVRVYAVARCTAVRLCCLAAIPSNNRVFLLSFGHRRRSLPMALVAMAGFGLILRKGWTEMDAFPDVGE